jgi:hypothetical protein
MEKLTLKDLKPGQVYLYVNGAQLYSPLCITYLRHFHLSDNKYMLVTTQGNLSYDDVWFDLFEVDGE